MKAIVFHNRELFIVKDFESCENEIVAFHWKQGEWGNRSFPLQNGVKVSWTKNYAVKMSHKIAYKNEWLHENNYSIEGVAEMMNIYNSKTTEQLEEELRAVQSTLQSELSEEIVELRKEKRQLIVEVEELKQQKVALHELPDRKVSFLKRLMNKIKK